MNKTCFLRIYSIMEGITKISGVFLYISDHLWKQNEILSGKIVVPLPIFGPLSFRSLNILENRKYLYKILKQQGADRISVRTRRK